MDGQLKMRSAYFQRVQDDLEDKVPSANRKVGGVGDAVTTGGDKRTLRFNGERVGSIYNNCYTVPKYVLQMHKSIISESNASTSGVDGPGYDRYVSGVLSAHYGQ
jgi:hypothetical protein